MKYFITFISIVAIVFLEVDFVTAQNLSDSEVKQLKSITGIRGEVSDGEYKITIPQNDLNVKADGFDIIPPMGMGSWVAFKKAAEGG